MNIFEKQVKMIEELNRCADEQGYIDECGIIDIANLIIMTHIAEEEY